MQTPKLESKRIFLIASGDELLVNACRESVERQIAHPTIFTAADGAEALFKIGNVLPHVAIIDPRLSKTEGSVVAERLMRLEGDHTVSVILLSEIPSTEQFVHEVITRQIQFLPNCLDDQAFSVCLSRALNRISLDENSAYRLHFLAPKDVLFTQGDGLKSIFFVKKGQLEVVQQTDDKKTVLGQVSQSEFVGEMAYFNNEARSATVRAMCDCELIEIPGDVVDMVLFSKPAWAKALVETLSRRLKRSNASNVKTAVN